MTPPKVDENEMDLDFDDIFFGNEDDFANEDDEYGFTDDDDENFFDEDD